MRGSRSVEGLIPGTVSIVFGSVECFIDIVNHAFVYFGEKAELGTFRCEVDFVGVEVFARSVAKSTLSQVMSQVPWCLLVR